MERGVQAQCICERPRSAVSDIIRLKVEVAERGIQAQYLSQRVRSPVSQIIVTKDELAERGIRAQKLQYHPRAPISQLTLMKVQRSQIAAGHQVVQVVQQPPAIGETHSIPRPYTRMHSCFLHGRAHRL